jgi:hypothetical protein
MLDFAPIRQRTRSIVELAADLRPDDLQTLTNEMIDTMREILKDCHDQDVVFVPDDPDAHDTAAATLGEVDLCWTLGHVLAHTLATAEESAVLAAELARGVPHRGGRSRREVPWQTVTTVDECLRLLEESRRIRLASLAMWPDRPDLNNTYPLVEDGPPYVLEDRPEINAVARFILGFLHDDSHLAQLANIVEQAQAARAG